MVASRLARQGCNDCKTRVDGGRDPRVQQTTSLIRPALGSRQLKPPQKECHVNAAQCPQTRMTLVERPLSDHDLSRTMVFSTTGQSCAGTFAWSTSYSRDILASSAGGVLLAGSFGDTFSTGSCSSIPGIAYMFQRLDLFNSS